MKKIMLLFVLIYISTIGFSNEKGTPLLLRDSTILVPKLDRDTKDSISVSQDTIKSINVRPLENIETLNISNPKMKTMEVISKNPENSVKNILQSGNNKTRVASKQKTIPAQSRWSKKSN